MDISFLSHLVAESVKGKNKKRENELKVFIALIRKRPFLQRLPKFKVETEGLTDKKSIHIKGVEVYVEEKNDIAYFYTAERSNKSHEIQTYIQENPNLKSPWIEGYDFKKHIQKFISDLGVITGYSAEFKPFEGYTGYGITLRLWGGKSDEILNKIKDEYVITPTGIKADLTNNGTSVLSFRVSNDGRLSYISGKMELFLALINYYTSLAIRTEERYDARPIKEQQLNGISSLDFKDRFTIEFNDSKGSSQPIQKDAIRALKDILTRGGLKYGFLGYALGDNKLNVVDLKENKLLFVTLSEQGLSVLAKNPTEAQPSLRNIHQLITEHIHPFTDIKIEPVYKV